MKKRLLFLALGVGLLALGVAISIRLSMPWMDRYGATDAEVAAIFPGDELVPDPARFVNRAITIQAGPDAIYPWLLQLDAEKGGWYSYDWLETNLLRCPMVNADRIHPEWQNRQVGDAVRMCPGDGGPPPYIVAQLHPDRAMVLGHQENGEWVDLYQFVIVPQTDGSSRLILRTRTMMAGGLWDLIYPGVFLMERGMLGGIKARAEERAEEMARDAGNEHRFYTNPVLTAYTTAWLRFSRFSFFST